MNGFYLMHRGWMDNPAFKKEPFTEREAFEWLISEAAWADGKVVPVNGMPITLERGQLSHSIRFMAQAWGWKKDKASRFLDRLKKWDMIETQNETAQLVISICNYSKYQDGETQNETAASSKPRQERDRGATNKKETKQTKQLKDNSVSSETPKPSTQRGVTLEVYFKTIGQADDELAPDEWFDWAKLEYPSIPPPEILNQLEALREWARANANRAVAKKLDWKATWQGWMRREAPKITERMKREERYGQKLQAAYRN